MKYLEIEKNRLDLAYQKQLHYLNAVLILGTTGILSFIGTFIWNKDYLAYGLLFTIIVITVSWILFKKVDKNLKKISEEIKKLS